MRIRSAVGFLTALLLLFSVMTCAQDKTAAPAAPVKDAVLKAADVGDKLMPDKVFFRGQVASVQGRNSGGVRFADGFLVLSALVDSSGYSSGLKEKYQGYLITEVNIAVGGKILKPGAYGFGFIEANKFVVMDLGANEVFVVSSAKDTELNHPVPLQVTDAGSGTYRLYKGRDFVEFKRAK